MKKTMALLLALCMLTAFAGCKDKNNKDSKAETQVNSEVKEKESVNTSEKKYTRALGESPENVALMFCRGEKNMDMDMLFSCIHPESALYQDGINDEDMAPFLASGKSPLDILVDLVKKEYEENGLTVADEEFVRAYYEKGTANVEYSVNKVEQKSEDEVVVSIGITKDYDLGDKPDFSVLTLENTDVDKFVEERAIHYYTNHVTLKNYDGEWYVEDMMRTREYGG